MKPLSMYENLTHVTRILQGLWKALPAIRAQGRADVLQRHVELIRHYQRLHERLLAAATPAPA